MARRVTENLGIDGDEVVRLQELIRRCETSRQNRMDSAQTLRTWYETGSNSGEQAKYNKIYSHLNLVLSFIFSPGTVRFGVYLPPSVRKQWLSPASIARDEFRQVWENIGQDELMLMALEWGLVYGSTLVKTQPDPIDGFRSSYVQPWDFGVSREDVQKFDEQDVCCHWYTLSMPQFERWVAQEESRGALLQVAANNARPARPSQTRARLVLSSVSGVFPGGNIAGGFPGGPSLETKNEPQVEEPTIELVDVWERRIFKRRDARNPAKKEEFEDWLVTTFIADAKEPVAQRRNPDLPNTRVSQSITLPAELPFSILCPRPIPDYFWGRSELDNLTSLQDWLGDYITDLKLLVKKQLDPPKFFSGVADFEEAGRAMTSAGGSYGSPEPTAKMEKLMPELRGETLQVYKMILEMFADTSGVPMSIGDPGQMPGGVRATGHFSMAAGIGAGRLREMALVVESALGDIATKGFHCLQRQSTEVLTTEDGKKFLLSQIPYMVSMRVNAHSAAPIFSEQTQAKAMLLQKAGAIGPDDFVELIDPPNRDEYKERARQIAQNKSETQQHLMQIQEAKALKTGSKK